MSFSRVLHLVPVLAAAVALPAAEELVTVRDFSLRPAGNVTLANGTLSFHPKALLTAGYNSNVYSRENDVVGDQYGSIAAGVETRWAATDALTIAADLQFIGTAYADETNRNLSGGTGNLTADWKGEVARAGAKANYQRYDDPLVQTGERIKRENADGSLYLGWEGVDTKGQVSGGARSQRYLEDGENGSTADSRSNTGATGSARYAWVGGSNTELFGSVTAATYKYKDNTRLQDGTSVVPTVGIQTLLADRATLLVQGGVGIRTYSDEFATDYDDQQVTTPEANVALQMPFTELTSVTVRGYATSDNGLTSNAYRLLGGGAQGKFGLTDRFGLFASGDVVKITDTASAPGVDAQDRLTTIGSAGAQFEAVRGLAFRLKATQTNSTLKAGTGDDFKTTEVALDTAFAF